MPLSAHLLRKLQETLGADAAADLGRLIEDMDGQRGDLAELRHEMQLGFARLEARFDAMQAHLDGRFAATDARIVAVNNRIDDRIAVSQAQMMAALDKGLREQTRFFFLAWSVILAAIVGLYAR